MVNLTLVYEDSAAFGGRRLRYLVVPLAGNGRPQCATSVVITVLRAHLLIEAMLASVSVSLVSHRGITPLCTAREDVRYRATHDVHFFPTSFTPSVISPRFCSFAAKRDANQHSLYRMLTTTILDQGTWLHT